MLEEGTLRVPYSIDSKFSFVALRDVAEAAAIVLSGSGHASATYELAGPEALSHREAAEIFSRALNRPVRAEREAIEAWRRRAAGLSPDVLEKLVAMFEYYDAWGLAGSPNVLGWVLGREPMHMAAFIAEHLRRPNPGG